MPAARLARLLWLGLAALPAMAAPAGADDGVLSYLSGLSWREWSSAFAGRSFIAADRSTATPGVTASIAGVTLGADTLLDENNLAGLSLTASRQTFSSGSADGVSDDRAVTLYGRHRLFGDGYLTEALGYGWHAIDTSRTVRLGGPTVLAASFTAADAGGRLEAGYGFALGGQRSIAPYAALVGDAYMTPAYSEHAAAGAPRFAVAFAGSTLGIVHGELGARYADGWHLADGTLSLEVLAGWQHDLDDNPFVLASFLVAPSDSFLARGTRPAIDTGLAGMGLRFARGAHFSFGARADTRLGARTTIFSGTLDAAFSW